MGGKGEAVKDYDINPVLQSYGPGGDLLGRINIMIYNMWGLVLKYYNNFMIREVLLLFPTQPFLLLLCKTGHSPEGRSGGMSEYLT